MSNATLQTFGPGTALPVFYGYQGGGDAPKPFTARAGGDTRHFRTSAQAEAWIASVQRRRGVPCGQSWGAK